MSRTQKQTQPLADRPQFAAGYGIDRAKTGGMLSWQWMEERMIAARNYWIATSSLDGRPHAAPVWGVWLDGVFIFGTDRLSRKGRNLAHNPRVVVHLESGDEAVIFEGTLEEMDEPKLFNKFADAYAAKYNGFRPDPEHEPGNVYFTLKPSAAYAWRESDFPESATRWQFDEKPDL